MKVKQHSSETLRVVFLGTSSDFSMIPLKKILRAHKVIGIVESGARGCQERDLSVWKKALEWLFALAGKPSLWAFARRKRLPYFYLCRGNESSLKEFLNSLQPDVGCIASFNQLLPSEIIRQPRLGMVNFHPSLLPLYRGPNVWFWQYFCNDRTGGATIHQVDEGEDTGDILKQESFPIPIGMDVKALRRTIIRLGAQLMVETLSELARGKARPQAQRHLPCPQRARRLAPGEDLFRWQEWGLEHCYHFLRGLGSCYRLLNRSHGIWGAFPWKAYGMEKGKPSLPGKIMFDRAGFYFAHPQGKIRLRLAVNPVRLALLAAAGACLIWLMLMR